MQRINRLLMLRARNLAGPFFQRVGANTYARSAGNFFSSGGGLEPVTDNVINGADNVVNGADNVVATTLQ